MVNGQWYMAKKAKKSLSMLVHTVRSLPLIHPHLHYIQPKAGRGLEFEYAIYFDYNYAPHKCFFTSAVSKVCHYINNTVTKVLSYMKQLLQSSSTSTVSPIANVPEIHSRLYKFIYNARMRNAEHFRKYAV